VIYSGSLAIQYGLFSQLKPIARILSTLDVSSKKFSEELCKLEGADEIARPASLFGVKRLDVTELGFGLSSAHVGPTGDGHRSG
jgi:hypothetical protein